MRNLFALPFSERLLSLLMTQAGGGRKVGAVLGKPCLGVEPVTQLRHLCWGFSFYLEVCLRWVEKKNQCQLSHCISLLLLPSDSCSELTLGELLQWERCLANSLLWGVGGTCCRETCWARVCSSWSSQPNSLSKVMRGCLILCLLSAGYQSLLFPCKYSGKRKVLWITKSSDKLWH